MPVWTVTVGSSSAFAAAGLNWGSAVKAQLPAGAASSADPELNSVSCAAAGECAAVGYYRDSAGNQQGLLLNERSGRWAPGVKAKLPADAGTSAVPDLYSVSCGAAGDCVAVGDYLDSSGAEQSLLVNESSGTWAPGVKATPADAAANPYSVLFSVSCAAAGDCAAVGTYTNNSGAGQGLLVNKDSGTWTPGAKAKLPADAGTPADPSLTSVSCAAAGDCAAVGTYTDNSGHLQHLLVDESSGTWAPSVKAKLPADAGTPPTNYLRSYSVSCGAAGNCATVGEYTDSSGYQQGLLVNDSSGTWATGLKAKLPVDAATNPDSGVTSVSCAAAGDCSAAGFYTDGSGTEQGLLVNESSGTWATGLKAKLPAGAATPAYPDLTSVSCAAVGDCAAVGYYLDTAGRNNGLLLNESSGTWTTGVKAKLPPDAATAISPNPDLTSVSCATTQDCAAVGYYTDRSNNQQGLLLDAVSHATLPGPKCRLKPISSHVKLVTVTKKGKKSQKGVLKLTAKCDQAAKLKLTGTITARFKAKKGQKTSKRKTFKLGAVTASARANKSLTLTAQLPKRALTLRQQGIKESAAFALTATNSHGTGTATAGIAKLKL